MTDESFVCTHCDKVHAGLPTDWSFNQPDEIHALAYLEKYARTRYNTDLATLNDTRYFMRGVLMLPFETKEHYFGWGIWVEVGKVDHDNYVAEFSNDASNVPRFGGRIANELPGYESTLNLAVEVQLGNSTQRPTFWLPSGSTHLLALDQTRHVSDARHHQILEACGFFSGQP